MLKNMFYKKTNFLIASVNIKEQIAFHKADSKWIAEYEINKNSLSIENYWKGINFDSNPDFEYLIEGIIELRDQKDRNYIEDNSILKQK